MASGTSGTLNSTIPYLYGIPIYLLYHTLLYHGEKRFSIWQLEYLHPAMWHDYDLDFTRWLHPAMWHVALGSWQWIRQVAAPCYVIRSSGIMTLICQVAAPCNVTCGSGITCHWIRPNIRHIGILHLVSILTISPQSTCHSAPVSDEILSKSDHRWQKKIVIHI